MKNLPGLAPTSERGTNMWYSIGPTNQGCAVCTELLTPLAAKMAEEPFKLLIMDSITANLRVDFSGRGELAERCLHRQLN